MGTAPINLSLDHPVYRLELRNQQAKNTQLPQLVLTAETVDSICPPICPSGHTSALRLYCLRRLGLSSHFLSSIPACSSAEF